MTNRSFWPRPPALLALSVFACLTLLLSRVSLPQEEAPALRLSALAGIWVELGDGFARPGVHQFSDGTTLGDVIKLTGQRWQGSDAGFLEETVPLFSGERLDLFRPDKKVTVYQRSWMSASARITLGIPLHPDRMSRTDWLALPGVGPRLAERIETDRQINGEFGGLGGLQRVSGIGPGRVKSWAEFF